MTAGIAPLTARPAWQALAAHYQKVRELHLRQLFAHDSSTNTLIRRYRTLQETL